MANSNLMSSSLDELLLVDEIGDRISESIVDFFSIKENVDIIYRLKKGFLVSKKV